MSHTVRTTPDPTIVTQGNTKLFSVIVEGPTPSFDVTVSAQYGGETVTTSHTIEVTGPPVVEVSGGESAGLSFSTGTPVANADGWSVPVTVTAA